MTHTCHRRPLTGDKRSQPCLSFDGAQQFARVEGPFTSRCKQVLPTARRPSECVRLARHWQDRQEGGNQTSCGSKHSTPSHRSLLLSPWDACPYIKMWFGALARNTARRGWMRGIGITVQTTEPQSPSCSTAHTQLLACVMFVHVLYIWAGGGGVLTRSFLSLAGSAGWSQSLHLMEVQFQQCV